MATKDENEVQSISDMVALDYDGSEFVDREEARMTLVTWCRNNSAAKKIIEKFPMAHQVTVYCDAWSQEFANEYGLNDNEE